MTGIETKKYHAQQQDAARTYIVKRSFDAPNPFLQTPYEVQANVGGWAQHAQKLSQHRGYPISATELMAANPVVVRKGIEIGKLLRVPPKPGSKPVNLPDWSGPTNELEITSNDDGTWSPVLTARENALYIDKKVEAVGYSIYLFGFHLYIGGMTMPIHVPQEYAMFGDWPAKAISEHIFPDRSAADAALGQRSLANGSSSNVYAYYYGAGGKVIVPTMFAMSTCPVTFSTLQRAIRQLVEEVTNELTVMAMSLVGGMLLQQFVTGVARVAEAKLTSKPGGPTPVGAGAKPAVAASARPSLRPRASQQQLRNMLANPNEFYVWETGEADVALNQTVRFTGETVGTEHAKVHLFRGIKGRNYGGGQYKVIIKGSQHRVTQKPGRADEFLIDEIPATEGWWVSAEDLQGIGGH